MKENEGLLMKYFVLKPSGNNIYAKASREAMRKYAEAILPVNQTFADNLKEWVLKEEDLVKRSVENLDGFKNYKRTNIAEMRPYVLGEDMTNISVADVDEPRIDMGMVARNPKNHKDQWYVAKKYFEDNFEEI